MIEGGVMSVSVDVIRVKEEPGCQQQAAGEAPGAGAGAPCQRGDDPPVVMVPERMHIKMELGLCAEEVVRLNEEPSVYCSEIEGEGCSGVSEAAMLANLYANHIIKDELVLGPEHPHRPTLLPSPLVHIKEEPQKYVKEEALGVEGELQASSSEADLHGVSAAAMLAGLYTDHVVKDELLLGPELPHRPTVNPVFYDPPYVAPYEPRDALALCAWDHTYAATGSAAERGRAMSSDTAVAEALGRRCSVRLERSVGRRTHRLRPESEPPRAATPATNTFRCDHCHKTFAHKSVISEHIHTHLSTRLAQSRYSTRDDFNLDQQQKLDTSLKGNLQMQESTLTREKPFQCNYCDFRFSLKRELRIHEMTHTGVKPFQCNYCDYKCTVKGNLRIHEMTHTGEKPYQCNYCDYKCTLKGNLRIHEMTHTGEKPYQCNYCDYKCSQKGSLRIHEMTHTGVKLHQCNYCDYKCNHKGRLRIHEMTHTGVKLHQCNYCDYKCNHKGRLRIHEMTHTGVKPFQCNYCDYKCTVKRKLRIHEMTHTGIKPFQCNYCDYKCNQKGNLRIHEMTHTGEKPYQCNYCDYKCNQKGNLRIHEMTHTGEKPFQCNYCDYKCTVKRKLRVHEMIHTGVKPFQCNYCDYKCTVKGSLRIDVMTHTGVKPFQCHYCDYKCTVKRKLRIHEMTHTGEKPYQCNYCDYKCNQKGNLRIHEMTHTGESLT